MIKKTEAAWCVIKKSDLQDVLSHVPGPVFVVQWLFDEAQLTVDNIHLTGQPVHESQWRYIQSLGQELRSTLRDVP